MLKTPTQFERISATALTTIRAGLLQDDFVYRVSWDELLRYFLSHFLGDDAQKMSVADLRAAYMELPGADTGGSVIFRRHGESPHKKTWRVPDEPREFAQFIARTFLRLKELPRATLARLYAQASDDLRDIDRNIKECYRLVGAVSGESRPDEAATEHQSWAQVHKYYLQQNETARQEIVHFLAHEIKQKTLAISQNVFGFHFLSYTYPYREDPSSFDPDDYSDVANKFSSEPLDVFYNWTTLYRDDQEAFFIKLDGYLERNNVLDDLRGAMDTHHRLHARKSVLKAAFDAYEAGSWEVFATLVVVQIEGLVLDYCEDLGVQPTELARSSLPAKAHAILRHKGYFSDFPYYAYRLPVLRNHLAHGRPLSATAQRDARLLLLDLAAVVKLVQDPDLLVNQCVQLLRPSGTFSSLDDTRRALLAHALFELGVQAPPQFYGLDGAWNGLMARLNTSEMISFARNVASFNDPEAAPDPELSLFKSLIILMVRRTENKDPWRDLLRTPPLSGVPASERKFDRSAWETFRNWIESHNVTTQHTIEPDGRKAPAG